MKAICKEKGLVGLVPDEETYEKLKHGTTDWRDTQKARMNAVQIPYDLFMHLMKLDMAVETACARKKAEEETDNGSDN